MESRITEYSMFSQMKPEFKPQFESSLYKFLIEYAKVIGAYMKQNFDSKVLMEYMSDTSTYFVKEVEKLMPELLKNIQMIQTTTTKKEDLKGAKEIYS